MEKQMKMLSIPVLLILAILCGIKTSYGIDWWNRREGPFSLVWTQKKLYMASLFWLAVYAAVWFLAGRSFDMVRFLDLVWTYVMLAFIDGRRRSVPDSVLGCFWAGQMLMGAMTLWPAQLLGNIITGTVFAILILCFTRLSRGKIGMGDAKLLGVTAVVSGWRYTVQLLCWAFVPAFLYSIWLLLFRRVSMKTEIPFVPCLAAGMILHMLYFVF